MIAEGLLAEFRSALMQSGTLQRQSLTLRLDRLAIGPVASRQVSADGEFVASNHDDISPYWRTDSNRKSDGPAEKKPGDGGQVIWLVPSGAPGLGFLETDADVTAEALGEGDDVEFFLSAHSAPPAEDFELLDALDELCLCFPTSRE
jgi:hypothetical protein